MKNVLSCLVVLLAVLPLSAQEEGALLGDLLNIQPVEFNDEGTEEELAEYDKALEDEKAKMEDQLTKLNDDYKKEIADNIDNFNKVLEETDEKAVANEKQAMITRVRTMTMALKKNKKDVVQEFKNNMILEIRKLPLKAQQKREKIIDQIRMEHFDKFDKEYEANMRVLETFTKTKHLIKKDPEPETDMGSESGE